MAELNKSNNISNNNNNNNNNINTNNNTDQSKLNLSYVIQSFKESFTDLENADVIWFPKNDLQSEEKPFLGTNEVFEYEKLPLFEAALRIYNRDYDFDKYLSHQLESTSMTIACSFLLGTLVGGLSEYYQVTKEVQNKAKQYQGKILDNKTRAKIYNEGAHLIRVRVSRMGIITGLKLSILATSYGFVNYQLLKYRRRTDPLNHAAGGLSLGITGGLMSGGLRGMIYGGFIMGGLGLLMGVTIEGINYIAALGAKNKTE